MNKIITSVIAALTFIGTVHAAELPDTSKINPGRTLILEDNNGTTIVEITDLDGNTTRRRMTNGDVVTRTFLLGFPTEYKTVRVGNNHKSRWTVNTGGFNIGWVSAPSHPDIMPIEMGKSLEIGWFEIIGVGYDIGPTTTIKLGFGMDWKNYKITTPDYRIATGVNNAIISIPYPAGTTPINSRIKVFTLSMPLMVRQEMPFSLFGQKQWLAVGVAPGLTTHGSVASQWRNPDGKKGKESSNKIGHRKWSYEIVGIAGLSSDVGIFIRYQPMSVLKGDNRPDFKSLSTGLILFY